MQEAERNLRRIAVIATTNSSGVASVAFTLPSTAETVTVTAKDQSSLGGISVSFTGTANLSGGSLSIPPCQSSRIGEAYAADDVLARNGLEFL